ncbi:MAG: molybdopterin cofactor-binding domain-containing protein, partial [Desulfobacterales bacterium]
ITNHHKIRRGDIEKGFAESDLIIEEEFRTQHVEHAYIEPESALCIPRPDGVMEVFGSMQHPFSTRRFTAAILGVPLSEVEVKTIPMGGGFGGKDDTAALVCARAALAARLTGRPVKLTYEREWSMRESYKRHPYRMAYKMGLTAEGTIKAMQVRTVADAGAYCSVTPWVTWRSTVQCCGPYCVDHVHCDTYGVYTNNVFTGAFRGFGSPQINFAIEQLVEIAAERLQISPIEFRRRNMVRDGSTTITGQVLDNHTVSMQQVLDSVLDEIDYEAKLERCAHGRGDAHWYGIGLAMSYRGVSLGAEGMDFNAAVVNVQFDGSILLETAVHENGQGAESAMILILAQELGVSKERIRYRQPSTSNIPDGGTTVASRGTIMGGSAVVDAATRLKAFMAKVIAPHLDCAPEAVVFKNDRLCDSGSERSISFEEALHHMFLSRAYPYQFGSFKAPDVSWDEETGSGNAYFTWVYGCQAVELTVNPKNGAVTLLNAVAAHDVGRAINPPMLKGQFYGGMAQGIG